MTSGQPNANVVAISKLLRMRLSRKNNVQLNPRICYGYKQIPEFSLSSSVYKRKCPCQNTEANSATVHMV